MNVGDKILIFKNPEDMMSAYIWECLDIYEVGLNEFYFEIAEKQIKHVTRTSIGVN